MKNTVIIFAFIFFSTLFWKEGGGGMSAQQLSFSSQYYTNQFVTNPAFTGNGENINAYLTHRSQWISVPGAPQTSYLTLDAPLDVKNVGLGLNLYSYVTDILSRVGAFATYSYKIKINKENSLSLGLAMGMLDNKIDFAKAYVHDTDDPLLFAQQQNKTIFSADFGLAYSIKSLEVGFAVPQILGNKIQYGTLNGDNSYYNLSRHYQGSFKYLIDIDKKKGIKAFPLIMFRTVSGAPFQYDISAVVDWKKSGWFGITYHSSYALAVSGGVRYKNLSIGYAYDIGISKIKAYTGSSTEFLLGFTFNKKSSNEPDTAFRGDLWAEEIQSSSSMVKPQDYDDAYWKSINKNVDQQKIFNTIVDAVVGGKIQAYDLITDSPLSVTQVQAFLLLKDKNKSKGSKKVTKNDISKIRMQEKWIFDKNKFKLTKQVTRIDLLLKRVDESGDYTGDDRPLFYVKMKK